MSLSLELLNLFIGMCKGTEGLPRDLFQLGYRDIAVEFRFANANGDTVHPELIVASEQTRHAILFEWKSGPNTDANQLARYAGVTRDDLRERAYLPPTQSEAHDVSVVGLSEHRDRITIGITRGGYDFPVVLRSTAGLETILNQFKVAETDSVFRPRLAIDWARVPSSFFPVDKDSPLLDFAALVMPVVFEEMAQGSSRILANYVGERIIRSWEIVDRQYQREVTQKISVILQRASNHEFSAYLRRNKAVSQRTGTQTWDVTDNPLYGASDRRAKAWRDFKRRQKALLDFFGGATVQQDLPLE